MCQETGTGLMENAMKPLTLALEVAEAKVHGLSRAVDQTEKQICMTKKERGLTHIQAPSTRHERMPVAGCKHVFAVLKFNGYENAAPCFRSWRQAKTI